MVARMTCLKILLRIVVTFVLLACVADRLAFAEAESTLHHPVPDEVTALAESILHEQWKNGVKASPSFYKLEGVDVTKVSLGEPFHILELRGDALDSFVNGTDDDPRAFPALEKFCFPVLLPDGNNVGTIMVMRNRDEKKNKIITEKGEYMLFGYLERGAPILAEIGKLRKAYPGQTDVYLVSYVDGGVPQRYMIQTNQGLLLSGTSTGAMRPIAEDARVIREGILRYQETIQRPVKQ